TGNPIIVPEDVPEVGMARQAAEDAIAKAVAELGRPGVEVTVRAVSGVPGEALVEASGDADLLVGGGARGISGFRRLLLGSVSSAVKVFHPAISRA
ncbi:MAG TPA: universal stress protein, partial [Isosphaeraceae bacterium]|nr:universal stress protein [Isosphaeraceae bacterium]